MAQHQIGGLSADEITARNRAVAGSVATTSSVYASPVNYGSLQSARTRLTAINGTYFTSARLDQMTANDIFFALRTLDDPNTI